MTSETRYFRSDSQTINGLACRKLLTTQSGVAGELTISSYDGNQTITQYVGIRVWKRSSGGTETEIDPSAVKAIGSGSTSGTCTGTYTPTQTVLDTGDSIIVRVYGNDVTPPTTLLDTWQTEQLGETQLDSVQWTLQYYIRRYYRKVGGLYLTTYYFSFDTVTYDSKISSFSHSTPAGGVVLPVFFHHLNSMNNAHVTD